MKNKYLKFINCFLKRCCGSVTALKIKHCFEERVKPFKNNTLCRLFYALNQKRCVQKILKSACPVIFLTTLAFGDVTSDSLQSVSAGFNHTCGITTDISKSVYCWGDNSNGQLGNNSTTQSLVPVKV